MELIFIVGSLYCIVYLIYKMYSNRHRHEYKKIGFRQTDDGYIRYSIRKYRCQTCGYEKEVDGRFDKN